MRQIKNFQSVAAKVIAILVLFIPYSMTLGDQDVSLTVQNATPYYLHVIMNGDAFLYIGPRRTASLSLSTDNEITVFAQAFYAPGQGIEGSAQNSFVIGGTVVKGDCSSGTQTCATEPAHSSTSWIITPNLLIEDPPVGSETEVSQ